MEIELVKLSKGRLYYHEGNFFQPMDLGGADHGKVKRALRDFLKENRTMVDRDRAAPGYMTLMQLADLPPET